MILVFSREPELAINGILLWLHSYRAGYIRITENTRVEIEDVQLEGHSCQLRLKIDGRQLCLDEIRSCWIYHGHLSLSNLRIDRQTYRRHADTLVNALVRDVKTLLEFTKYLLEQTNCIGRFNEQNTNKLKYLHWAGQAGLQIPSSAVFASRSALARYQKEQKRRLCCMNPPICWATV